MPEHKMRREPAHFFECTQDAVPVGPETSAELSTAGGVDYAPTPCDGTLDRFSAVAACVRDNARMRSWIADPDALRRRDAALPNPVSD
jgi:hypothetical protein